MKNMHVKKWMLILALTLCLNTVAFAEGDEAAAPAPAAQVEQVKEEKKAEAPKAEKKEEAEEKKEPEKKEEAEKPAEAKAEPEKPAEAAPEAKSETPAPAEEVTAPAEAPAEPEAPAEEEAPAETEAEAPAEDAEETEAPEEETVVGSEDAADDELVEIDDYDTPLGVTPDPEPAPFNANVKLQMRSQGEIFYGDKVTIEADISGATSAYDIRWEVDRHDDKGWNVIAGQNQDSYDFVITEDNASYEYRVVLTAQA